MKKRIAWAMMSAGFGALWLFGMALLVKGNAPGARDWFVYVWPSAGMAIGVSGLLWSRVLYRAEPPVPPAAWTVQLVDLIAGTVFAGFCGALAIGNADEARKLTPVFCLTGLALYVHGALAASLAGVFNSTQRLAYVVAHVVLTLGYLGGGTLALILTIIAFLTPGAPNFDEAVRWLNEVLWRDVDDPIQLLFRWCVAMFPVGLVLMGVVRRWVGRTARLRAE